MDPSRCGSLPVWILPGVDPSRCGSLPYIRTLLAHAHTYLGPQRQLRRVLHQRPDHLLHGTGVTGLSDRRAAVSEGVSEGRAASEEDGCIYNRQDKI